MTGSGKAELILEEASIWTGEPSRGKGPGAIRRASALAVGTGGRILAVGSEREVRALRGPGTRTLALEGRCVLPGFVDAHVHLVAGGLHLSRVDLRGVTTEREFMDRVAERAAGTPLGDWILGGGWNEADWGGGLPRRDWVDRAAPEHPVFLHRSDLHMGVANAKALRVAGIDPEGDGAEATGILRESAILRVTDRVPEPPAQALREAVARAARHALTRGITQLHDMGSLEGSERSWASLELLRAMRREDELPVRVVSAVPLVDWRRLAGFVQETGSGDARHRWGVVKGFVDGSLGSSTAWFHEPYADDPDNRGGPVVDLRRLAADLESAVAAGLQPAVHAIGDAANDWILSRYRELRDLHPTRDLRLRVEHAQHLTPEAIRAAAAFGAVFSVQPQHLVDDGAWAERRIGPERTAGAAYAFRSLEAAGARLAFGSDWTVAELDPPAAIEAAVNRRVRGDGRVWGPGERMDLDRALRAHTLGGAWAGRTDLETGTLAVGKRADFVVLCGSPFDKPPDRLRAALRVERTFVDGREVWELESGRIPAAGAGAEGPLGALPG